MGILRRNQNENNRQGRNDQALARAEPPQLARDQAPWLARDPFQWMREMMIDPYRAFQQLAPWSTFGGETRDLGWNPSFEVRETDDAFVFEGDMPGVRPEDLDVSLVGHTLQITGKRSREDERDEGTVHTYERSFGQFSRAFTLPETADLSNVRCDLKHGVLTLSVPKKPGTAPHRRKVQIGTGSKD